MSALALGGLTGAAGTASLTLSPSSGTHNINAQFAVTVYENSGSEAVDSASADMRYDVSKLQYVSHSFSGGAFDLCVASVPSGAVNIGCTRSSGTVTGNQKVATVTFKALVGSGTTAVAFAPGSAIVRNSDGANIWNANSAGGTYTLATPAPAPSPSPAPPPSPPGSSRTPNPATSSVSNGYIPSPAEQHANPSAPVPAVTGGGMSTHFLVAVKIVDQDRRPLGNARVTLGGQTVTSDETGIASFTNVAPGEYEVKAESAAGRGSSRITVSGDRPSAEVQEFEVKLAGSKTVAPTMLLPIMVLLVVAGAAVMVLLRRRLMRGDQGYTAQPEVGGSDVSYPANAGDIIMPSVQTPEEPTQPDEKR